MNINRLNYELFLVDYLDGKLDPLLVEELLIFLEQNPDIKEEFDGIQNSVLEKVVITFPNKSILKKKSFSKNGIDDELDYLSISSVEGTLSEEEQNLFNKEINENESLKKELQLFKKTVITADQSILYKNKSNLKRTTIVPIRRSTFKVYVSIAASITLLIGTFTLGRIILRNNSIIGVQEESLAIITDQPIKRIVPNLTTSSLSKKEINSTPKSDYTNVNSDKVLKVVLHDSLKVEIPIPEKLNRIELSEIPVSSNYPETLTLQTYPKQTYPLLLNKHLLASNENIEKEGHVKEIGVFEVIQYGVKSIGNFFGSNLQLTAKKDKNGKIKEIRFDSKLIAFTAPIGKNE